MADIRSLPGLGNPDVVLYSTATPLAGAGVFATANITGAAADDWITRGGIRSIMLSALADQASAAGGFVVEESLDGVNVANSGTVRDAGGRTTIGANSYATSVTPLVLTAPYFRVRYTNGATPQGAFSLVVTGQG